MRMNALQAALEGMSEDEAGAIEGQTTQPVACIPEEQLIAEMIVPQIPPREEMVAEVAAQLESHYAESDEVICHADEIRDYIQQNEAAHSVMREEIKSLRGQVEAVTGTMEMMAVISNMESFDVHSAAMLNVNMAHLGRVAGLPVPTFESIDDKFPEASMEGLVEFLKAGVDKIKNWFSDRNDQIRLDAVRQRNSSANFAARIQRIREIIKKLPEEHGKPVQPCQYKDQYLFSLFENNGAIEFDKESLAEVVAASTKLRSFATSVNADEHLANIKAISAVLPSLLMSIGNDGGEKATKDMIDKLAIPPSLTKMITYGKEVAGGVTYRSNTYRPSMRVAGWAQLLVELAERDRTEMQLRRNGRISIDYVDVKVMDDIVESIAQFLDRLDNEYSNYSGNITEAYNDAVSAYNKTLGLARNTDHSELTSEVWKAIDLASYVMMNTFKYIQVETFDLSVPSLRLIDGILYVFEEQLLRYVKVNR